MNAAVLNAIDRRIGNVSIGDLNRPLARRPCKRIVGTARYREWGSAQHREDGRKLPIARDGPNHSRTNRGLSTNNELLKIRRRSALHGPRFEWRSLGSG
jgi:hypothetical protein